MPRLIQTTITITRADLKAMEQARVGVEMPRLENLHHRMVLAIDQSERDRRTLNATSRRLKKTAGVKS